jgi:hypothetical protein
MNVHASHHDGISVKVHCGHAEDPTDRGIEHDGYEIPVTTVIIDMGDPHLIYRPRHATLPHTDIYAISGLHTSSPLTSAPPRT